MSKKPLIETNPYLKDPVKYEEALTANVATSTAIELGTLPAPILRELEEPAYRPEEITSDKSKRSGQSPR
jgi:hypothetical protein